MSVTDALRHRERARQRLPRDRAARRQGGRRHRRAAPGRARRRRPLPHVREERVKRPRKGAQSPPAARHPRKQADDRGDPCGALGHRRRAHRARHPVARPRRRGAEILLGAWNVRERGMYRPDPKDEPRDGDAQVASRHRLAQGRRTTSTARGCGAPSSIAQPARHAARARRARAWTRRSQAREVLEAMEEPAAVAAWRPALVDAPESLVRVRQGSAGINPRPRRAACASPGRRWR